MEEAGAAQNAIHRNHRREEVAMDEAVAAAQWEQRESSRECLTFASLVPSCKGSSYGSRGKVQRHSYLVLDFGAH